jgi:hypothetical protein
MRRHRLIGGLGAALAVGGAAAWISAPATPTTSPSPAYAAFETPAWELPAGTADALREDAFRRAQIRIDEAPVLSLEDVAYSPDNPPADSTFTDPLPCRYRHDEPSGTSSKFDCVLEDGSLVKVKYGRNSEIHAETAASSLLMRLGYAADEVRIVPRLRCYGCPRYPFFMSVALGLLHIPNPLDPDGYARGYTDFEWVSIESRFAAPAIATDRVQGWAWYELARSEAPRQDVDAFRLLAVFLAHWDNKSDNQRLVCLDGAPAPPDGVCARPLLMMQDIGATFGPTKVNLAAWRRNPIWANAAECRVTMKHLPYRGATFPDARISEGGRQQLAQRLAMVTDADARQMFADARFQEFYSATDDERDLDAWVAAFRHRVDQIVSAGPCPSS